MNKISYTRTITPLTDGKRWYVRTREIADALGIKQVYEFNSFLKKHGKVLKGETTEDFRKKNIDTSTTTFMRFEEIYRILSTKSKSMIRIAPNYLKVMKVLDKVLNNAAS